MEWLFYAIIAILIALFFIVKKPLNNISHNENVNLPLNDNPQNKNETLPYKKRDDFLSAAELSFYRTLSVFIQNKAVICPKVAVKEVVFIGKDVGKEYMKFFNWISMKHVDFVLCDVNTMRVVCAAELDDKSHQKETRKQRDAFVDRVFETAEIPLFHIPAKRGYTMEDFTTILNCFSEQTVPVVESSDQVTVELEICQAEINAPICTKCGIPMIKRKAMHGTNAGKEFYGCSNYPKCREVKQIKE